MNTPDQTTPTFALPEDFEARLAVLFRNAQIGACVNGVTHDINNLLGAAMAYAELVALDKNIGPEPKRMLGEIVKSTSRCSKMINTLTAIARKDTLNPSVTTPGGLLEATSLLTAYSFQSARVRLEFNPGDTSTLSMWCDAPKLQHALLSLLINSLEAVAGTSGAWVKLSAVQEGQRIAFVVVDAGMPLDADLAAKIFAPGFTTKAEGGHFGLGLQLAQQCAALHAGDLRYDAARGFVLTIDPMHLAKAPLSD